MEEQMSVVEEFHRWLRMCRKKKQNKKECHCFKYDQNISESIPGRLRK